MLVGINYTTYSEILVGLMTEKKIFSKLIIYFFFLSFHIFFYANFHPAKKKAGH